jgi:hypothetical protein
MIGYLINFNAMNWEADAPGLREKIFLHDDQRVRLLEFSDSFREAGWCRSGHTGYVLKGKLSIEFEREETTFESGDGLSYLPEKRTGTGRKPQRVRKQCSFYSRRYKHNPRA